MTSENTPALEVIDLSLRRGDTSVVESVSLSLYPGRMTGLLGPQSSGKSTVLRMLAGVIPPSSGHIVGPPETGDVPAHPGNRVGAVLGIRSTHPRRTALDHLKWIAKLVGEEALRCESWLGEFGLGDRAQTPAGDLSATELMRLSMAAALLGEPRVLVLDEPFPFLDPEATVWMEEFLRDCCAHGLSVLVSSRLLKELDPLVDEIVMMGRGRVVASGTRALIVDRFEWSWIALDVEDPHSLAPELVREGALLLDKPGETRLRISGLSEERVRSIASARGMSVDALRIVRDVNEDYGVLTSAVMGPEDPAKEEA